MTLREKKRRMNLAAARWEARKPMRRTYEFINYQHKKPRVRTIRRAVQPHPIWDVITAACLFAAALSVLYVG